MNRRLPYDHGFIRDDEVSADERLSGYCVYCSGPTESKDHVPSKVFLDEPLPTQLPIVECCKGCNAGFSRDEEYLASLLEVVRVGSATDTASMRLKIRVILERSGGLRRRLEQAGTVESGQAVWAPEWPRVEAVLRKLGQGHAAFELSAPVLGPPSVVECVPLSSMTADQREQFEGETPDQTWNEVGSRRLQRQAAAFGLHTSTWITVQPGRYRDTTDDTAGVTVRLVVGEYLAALVQW